MSLYVLIQFSNRRSHKISGCGNLPQYDISVVHSEEVDRHSK